MTKDQYLEMCAQMRQDPDWDKCPPDWEDFPDIVVDATNIYHSLGDRIYGDVGFIGKDFTTYDFLLKHYNIEEHQKAFILDTVIMLERRAVEIAQRRLKAEYDKIKNRGR